MKRLYEKNELTFSLIWIGIYVVVYSFADNFSRYLGIEKILTAPLSVAFVTVLLIWMRNNGLLQKYGLCRFEGRLKDYLYFIPLLIIASCNLWNGVWMKYSPFETILFVLSMLCVGFIEEIIFRGFLFKALSKDNIRQAIIVSSITFGLGHIVNLLNGSEFLSTLLQIIYATSIGFLFTILFYKSKSLWPCIITHSIFNSLSVIGAEPSTEVNILTASILTVISLGYTMFIYKSEM